MKKLVFILVCLMFLFIACEKVEDCAWCSTLREGSWRPTYVYANGQDQTRHFSGYKLTFTSPHTVTAIGPNMFSGYWDMRNDGTGIKLFIDFKNSVPFYLLNNSWNVTSYDAWQMQMVHQGNEVSGTGFLYMEKL